MKRRHLFLILAATGLLRVAIIATPIIAVYLGFNSNNTEETK